MEERGYVYYLEHREPKQRTLEWHEARFNSVITGSILGAILLCIPYPSKDKPRKWRGSNAEWHRRVARDKCIGTLAGGTLQDTGDLFADHMRRGVLLERPVAWLMEQITGLFIAEMPLIPLGDLMAVSPDGIDVDNTLYEIKCPLTVTLGRCKEHYSEPGSMCQDCARAACGIYWHQAQAELASVPVATGLFFVQLHTKKFVCDVLGLHDGRDDGTVLSEWVKSPCLPPGVKARDLLEIVYVKRDAGWLESVEADLSKFKKEVLEERKKIGMTFAGFAKINGLT